MVLLVVLCAAGRWGRGHSGAGANGVPVRVGIDAAVTGRSGSIELDGQVLVALYTTRATGDPPTLAAALNIPGGVIDTVARAGGTLSIEQAQQVRVPALRVPEAFQYARRRVAE